MSVTMCVYYREPEDAAMFEKRYLEEHLPLVRSYSNIQHTSFSKVSRRILGEFPYAYTFVATWADKDGWKADMGSEAAAKATEHAKTLGAAFDVVVYEDLG